MDEKQFILDSFDNNFSDFKNEKIVIYGLGKNTKLLLDERNEYNIVALMDGMRTGECVWDLPVITCEEANKLGVTIILIIATSANVPIIYQRIAQECEEYGIKVFDINGNEQKRSNGEYILPEFYFSCSKEDLLHKIEDCDVISFDIFDTLLVRNILMPTDLFENLVNKNKYYNRDFCKERINCERALYASTNPNIFEIYSSMAEEGIIAINEIEKYVELEIAEEKRSIFPRSEMVNVLNYAKKIGKIVCCTSDMYIPQKYIVQILNENGITNVDEVFVSCEYRVSKSNGLFDIVKEKYSNKKIMHIGDNHDADILNAKRYGIDETYEIPSIYRMATDSKISSILNLAKTVEDRNLIGMFVSHSFNNPFLFGETQGKLKISDCYELGFYFLEPIIEVFLSWMIGEVKNEKIEHLLLGSRDGWLIKELLDIYQNYNELPFEYSYFYSSRAACTMAGLETDEDIKYAASLAFDGSLREKLIKRFLLDQKNILERNENETDEHYLKRHFPAIRRKVCECRKNYKEYTNKLLINNKKIGFFDFVSSGTCQLWLEKIIEKPMIGIYFAKNYDKYKEHLNIRSLMKPAFVYEKQNRLYTNYVFLENIFTSLEPTLAGFDKSGHAFFVAESRTQEKLAQLIEIHRGIKEAFQNNLSSGKLLNNINIAEEIMDYVRPHYSISYANFFEDSSLLDEFCNRTFDLQKVLTAK